MTRARGVVLVLDREPHIPRLVALQLGDDYRVTACADGDAALTALHAVPYDVALVEVGGDAEPLLERVHAAAPEVPIIALAAAPTVADTVAAMRGGAVDVLKKSATTDEVRAAVARAAAHGSLAREVARLRTEVDRARGLGEIVGESAPMRALLGLVEKVAAADATVLILGESGTGKELLARTLHRVGPRAQGPFVAFDCSALAPSLLEAELFGHEKGAFTGAGRARRGLFREAHGGTIFLDEIGDVAPSVQNKLLRVLQEREIKPVGGDHVVPIDVRVVAATNKDLRALVARGDFREDLYWRLAVVPIQVPPLRERREDIPLLAGHILGRRRGAAKTSSTGARYPTALTQDALARLMGYHWPGNIRELENVLSRAAILCDGEKIRASDLDLAGLAPTAAAPARASAGLTPGRRLKDIVDDAAAAVERAAISEALAEAGGSPAAAARLLGVSRAHIYNKLRAYGLAHRTG
jgi:two-component system response regulator HydG